MTQTPPKPIVAKAVKCECCHELAGFAPIFDNELDGFVCQECYAFGLQAVVYLKGHYVEKCLVNRRRQ